MVDVETERFTVGVFQDVAWAQKGVDALKQAGFPLETLTILAKDGPEAAAFIEQALGGAAQRVELAGIGAAVGRGPWSPRRLGRATCRSWAWRAPCGASGFRRTTAAFSRR